MQYLKKSFLLLVLVSFSPCFTSLTFASEIPPQKICVLDFEQAGTRRANAVDRVFAGHPDVELKHEALPLDFIECVKGGFTEIVLVAHALETEGSSQIDLGFFRKLEGAEREETIRKGIEQSKQLIEMYHELAAQKREWLRKNASPKRSDSIWEDVLAGRYYKIEDALENYPASKPFYVVRPFLQKAFQVVRAELAAQRSEPQGVRLKKIRLLSCFPKEVQERYPDLAELVRENGIELDVAPTNPILSFFYGKPVTSLSVSWLKKSLEE